MRIDHTIGPGRLAASRPKRRQDGFAVYAESLPQAGETESAGPTVAVAALAANNSAASAESAAQDDRAAAQQGDALLDALAGCQLAALTGAGEAALATLGKLSAERGRAADPQLDALLQGIAARAAVELAKRE